MIIGGPLTVVVAERADGSKVLGEDIARIYLQLAARGLKPVWPPVHCPVGGADRFLVAGVGAAPPRIDKQAGPEAGSGGVGSITW